MKKLTRTIIAGSLLFSQWANAATQDSITLRNGTEKLSRDINRMITNMQANESDLNEADAKLLSYLLGASERFEQTITYLDDGDAALDGGDADTYLSYFALACNKVASARSKLYLAKRRADVVMDPNVDPAELETQRDDIVELRDESNCPT